MYKQLDVKFISIVSYCLFIIHVAELFLYRKSVNSAICVYKIGTCCKTLSSKIKEMSSVLFAHLSRSAYKVSVYTVVCQASLGRGNESSYKCSRSHDQDGRHGVK